MRAQQAVTYCLAGVSNTERSIMVGGSTLSKLFLACGAGGFCLIALTGAFVGASPDLFTKGLVSCWPADGNANDIVDGNNGTLEGGVTYGRGKPGQAFVFDGSTGSVRVPDSDNLRLKTNQFTLAAWIKPSAAMTGPRQGGIISKIGGSSGNRGYSLYITGDNTAIVIEFNEPNQPWPGHQLSVVVPEISQTDWTHVAATYDQRNLTLYENGEQPKGGTMPLAGKSIDASPSNFRISGDDNNNMHFQGSIDHIRVFNRALSASEIGRIMKRPCRRAPNFFRAGFSE